ncbi:hypothetical protein ACFWPK_24855 [Nocardia sp. NPDC058519]|uniref:hypothetical protein n=1 Tax=Nocardia sp. NPDC058519 TaxID=3346535 RepID=UPI003669CD0B
MGTGPERRVELGKDQVVPRVQDAPEVSDPSGGEPWGGIANPGPAVEMPPYPPPPPPAPGYPAPGYPAAGYPVSGNPVPGYPAPVRAPYGAAPYQPFPPQPGYGYQDNTPLWSIFSFCCAAASVFGGLALCGLPVLITAPTGIVLGLVGHAKGEEMGKWAAIVNGAIAALAALLVIVFVALLGGL